MSSAPVVYGGDEISALVLDPGSAWTRIGFAGEDTPKAVIPTFVGHCENTEYDEEILEDAFPLESDEDKYIVRPRSELGIRQNKNEKRIYYMGDNNINYPRSDMEIENPMQDGIVKDWDATFKLWEYGINDVLNTDSSQHPLLLTEQIWNSDENRTKAIEIAFESFNVPAFYIVKSPVCSLFASGKGSGLVVDIGSQITTVTPIVDGLVLYKTSMRNRYAGDYLSEKILDMFKESDVTVNPRYLVAGKEPFKPKSFLKPMTSSYHDLQLSRVLQEFKESMCQVSSNTTTNSEPSKRSFEFPDGIVKEFEKERFSVTESLFTPNEQPTDDEKEYEQQKQAEDGEEKDTEKEKTSALVYTDRSTNPFVNKGVSDLIIDCINSCDVDIRPNLANNIVIVGGSSLAQGFTERVNHDVSNALSGIKVRIYSPGNLIERKFSSWIGASILASLGTFHQLWISRKEYDEVGPAKLLEKRFR